MNELELVETALEQLQKVASIRGEWKPAASPPSDGKITFKLDQRTITVATEIKRELRNYHLPQLRELAREQKHFMLLAGNIFPTLREELRKENIAYLEANGNFYLKYRDIFILIEGNPPFRTEKTGSNRAFTPAGLEIVFHFLLDETRINHPYREIAEKTGASLGHIKNVMDGLKDAGFLLPKDDNDWMLSDKRELLNKWIDLYDEKLRPKLAFGNFRLVAKDTLVHWKEVALHTGKTYWGGEPAADLLTNHLRPGNLTLYTSETKAELRKNYHLVPDQEGPVKIFRKFWYQEDQNTTIVPPLLVYADLLNQPDKRSQETAAIIYEQYLEANF